MDTRNIDVVIMFATALLQVSAVSVYEGFAVTVKCPLDSTIIYPSWTGPDTLSKPLMTGTSFNEPEIQWEANNHDIKITKAMLKHEGTYTCVSNGIEKETNLTVTYFEGVQFNLTTENNGKTTLICGAYSKPDSEVSILIREKYSSTKFSTGTKRSTRNSDITTQEKESAIIYNGCKPDPSHENRNYCQKVVVWYFEKEDNGMAQECSFAYESFGIRSNRTVIDKVYINFPPTVVKITGNRLVTNRTTLNLTCSTDSSNPVSSLVWKTNNDVIENDAETTVTHAEYNGASISQTLSLEVSNAMNGKNISCCAADLCDSVNLNINIPTSGGMTATAWMTMLIVCLFFITYLQN